MFRSQDNKKNNIFGSGGLNLPFDVADTTLEVVHVRVLFERLRPAWQNNLHLLRQRS